MSYNNSYSRGGYGQGGYGAQHYEENRAPPAYTTTGTNPDVEMQQYGQQPQARDPNHILTQCQQIDTAINEVERNLERLRTLQKQSLSNVTPQYAELDALSATTMAQYRGLVQRMKVLKSQPESGSPRNTPQIGRVERRLKATIGEYQKTDADFRRMLQDQQARQYRIVRPEASEEEVRVACEGSENTQSFAQALMQSDRRGQSRSVLGAVESRHKAIQNIEKQIVELAQLFQDLNAMVVQQDPLIQNIEQKGEEVQDNVVRGNAEMDGAITKARSARRRKWYCMGITLLILIIIAIVVAVVVVINNRNHNSK